MQNLKTHICLILAVALLFLSSCGKNPDTQSVATQPAALEDDSVYASLSEDTLWLTAWGFDTFNPLCTKSEAVADCAFLVYDALFYLDETHRATPMLAQSFSVSEGGEKYSVRLNSAFKFHDGSDFTAKDVVYTINEIKSLGELSLFIDCVSNIKEAMAVDAATVEITLHSPESLFVNNLTFPIVKDGTAREPSVTEPVGTGPYKYVKSNLVRAMYFEANEAYPLGAPQIKNAVVNFIPERATQTYALEARRSDAACVTADELASYNPKGGVKTTHYNNRHLTFMGMNSMNDVLSFSAVRRSISLAVDRNDIVNTVLFGNGEQTLLPFPRDSFIYPEKYSEIKRNSSEAAALLEAAGFLAGADGVRVLEKPDGTRIPAEISILVNSDNEIRTQTARKISDSLRQVGIDATVEQVDFETYKSRIETGRYDMFIGEVQLGLSYMTTPLAGSSARYSVYSSDSLEDANNAVRGATGEEEIKAAYESLSDCYMNEMPIVCLYFGRDAMIASATLDYGGYAVSGNEFANLHEWEK